MLLPVPITHSPEQLSPGAGCTAASPILHGRSSTAGTAQEVQRAGSRPGICCSPGPHTPAQHLGSLLLQQNSPAAAQLFLSRQERNSRMLLGSYFCFQNLNK